MIRVSELLKRSANDLDRVVIMENGCLYPFNNKNMTYLDMYARRAVNSFYVDIVADEPARKLKQTMFIELKEDKK